MFHFLFWQSPPQRLAPGTFNCFTVAFTCVTSTKGLALLVQKYLLLSGWRQIRLTALQLRLLALLVQKYLLHSLCRKQACSPAAGARNIPSLLALLVHTYVFYYTSTRTKVQILTLTRLPGTAYQPERRRRWPPPRKRYCVCVCVCVCVTGAPAQAAPPA